MDNLQNFLITIFKFLVLGFFLLLNIFLHRRSVQKPHVFLYFIKNVIPSPENVDYKDQAEKKISNQSKSKGMFHVCVLQELDFLTNKI